MSVMMSFDEFQRLSEISRLDFYASDSQILLTNQYQSLSVSNGLRCGNQQNSSELGRFGSDWIQCDDRG